jgi:hypothetical protein
MSHHSKVSSTHGPGIFYVLSQPKSLDYLAEFHEWYNTEHGPLRLTLDFIENGYRYKSQNNDAEQEKSRDIPLWLATYDLNRVSGLEEPRYTHLRDKRSERENDVIDNRLNVLDRRMYKSLVSLGDKGGKPAPIIMCVRFVVKDEHVEEMNRWYDEVSETLF